MRLAVDKTQTEDNYFAGDRKQNKLLPKLNNLDKEEAVCFVLLNQTKDVG